MPDDRMTASEMQIESARASQLLKAYESVVSRMRSANAANRTVRLVLVSKLKPATDILALHQHESLKTSPPSHFGENYVQELQQKAAILPPSINWHFIGGLQSNKCKGLAEGIKNLYCVSSVDSVKKADQLEKGRRALAEKEKLEQKLRIRVQINTSGEESKSGVEPGQEAIDLCKHVMEACPHLQLAGLMTIGSIARSQATTAESENEDFNRLRSARDDILSALGIEQDALELSMGMSADFEGAIASGSDEVRVGSTIFGARPPKDEAKV